MLDEKRRCDKCQFWIRSEEIPTFGECRASVPLPYTVLAEDGETLKIHAMWPATKAHEFCFEFVMKEEEIEKEKFSKEKFIEWMNTYLWLDYIVDIEPSENGNGICGKISFKNIGDTNFKSEIEAREIYEHHDQEDILSYFKKFFAPEDIDVSFT